MLCELLFKVWNGNAVASRIAQCGEARVVVDDKTYDHLMER